MIDFIKKFISAFSYGSGFMLAVICAFYAVSQYSQSGVRVTSDVTSKTHSDAYDLQDIEVANVSKLSSFTNYVHEGKKEEFIFTGELTNNSSQKDFRNLLIEIDLYDSDNKFIFKCGGWDGTGIGLARSSKTTFQKTCYKMPAEVSNKYDSHKVNIQQRKW